MDDDMATIRVADQLGGGAAWLATLPVARYPSLKMRGTKGKFAGARCDACAWRELRKRFATRWRTGQLPGPPVPDGLEVPARDGRCDLEEGQGGPVPQPGHEAVPVRHTGCSKVRLHRPR